MPVRKGRIYDLDYLSNQGWVQVLIDDHGPAMVTKDQKAISILCTAFLSTDSNLVEIVTDNNEPENIVRVKLNR